MKQPSEKILILLPFYKGDRAEASAVARLLADLEPGYSSLADFAFVARRDTKQDASTVGYVSKKFNTFTCTSARHEVGFPQGCNGIVFGAIDWCLRGISSGKLPRYKALFLCASDTCPLVSDGIAYLHREWDRLSARGIKIAGAMVPTNRMNPQGFHINGDATLISAAPENLFWFAKQAGSIIRGGCGWDWAMAPMFEARGWSDLDGIKSHYRRPDFYEDEFDGYVAGGVKWLHGVKGSSLRDVVRKKLL